MNIDIKSEIKSSELETVDIHIDFNPSLEEEENLAAMIAATVDLVKKYHRLNTLAGDEDDNG